MHWPEKMSWNTSFRSASICAGAHDAFQLRPLGKGANKVFVLLVSMLGALLFVLAQKNLLECCLLF